ncbi:peptidase T [Escherichia coli]|uniref:Peptidase T n=1 Tax=Escherichia coli TaxID=562 RepID=A0A2X1IXH7_ECOLX|nr:peptidase T [Escherichia coli]
MGKGLHPDCYIELVIEDSYYNMREKVVEHPHILDIAQQAMRDCDIEPELKPIRGGTDGAQLSFMDYRARTCSLAVTTIMVSMSL